jgi:hypothetical protein
MKKYLFLGILLLLFVNAGCKSVGNGIAKIEKITLESPEYIDIEGDWRIEIVCGAAENSCEVIIDENLKDCYRIRSGKKFGAYLKSSCSPMVAPVLRLKLTQSFRSFEIEGNTICNIRNLKTNSPLEVNVDENAVCIFDKIEAETLNGEVSGYGKLALRGTVKKLFAELDERALLEVDETDLLKLKGSDNSSALIKSCKTAKIELEDNAAVKFKSVKDIDYKADDNATVDYPLVIPESLKK